MGVQVGSAGREHALKSLPTTAPVRVQLQQKLAQVMAEQDSRAKIAAAPVR
jgi:hypothetical protein